MSLIEAYIPSVSAWMSLAQLGPSPCGYHASRLSELRCLQPGWAACLFILQTYSSSHRSALGCPWPSWGPSLVNIMHLNCQSFGASNRGGPHAFLYCRHTVHPTGQRLDVPGPAGAHPLWIPCISTVRASVRSNRGGPHAFYTADIQFIPPVSAWVLPAP